MQDRRIDHVRIDPAREMGVVQSCPLHRPIQPLPAGETLSTFAMTKNFNHGKLKFYYQFCSR